MTDEKNPGNSISQDEIDALKAAMGGTSAPAVENKPAEPLNPAEVEAAMAAMAGEPVPSNPEMEIDDVEAAMLAMAGEPAPAPAPKAAPATTAAAPSAKTIPKQQATPPPAPAPAPGSMKLPNLQPGDSANGDNGLNLLDDVELEVKIELGRTELYIEDVLRLGVGSVVELDKLAGDPVDIYVNERLVARGEVLVLNENFCVRVNDILSPVPELGDPE